MSNLKTGEKRIKSYMTIENIFVVISVVVNLIAYKYLPERMGIHMSGGEFDSYANKAIVTLITPLILLLISMYGKINNGSGRMKALIVAAIILGVNFWMIYCNLTI